MITFNLQALNLINCKFLLTPNITFHRYDGCDAVKPYDKIPDNQKPTASIISMFVPEKREADTNINNQIIKIFNDNLTA